MLLIKASGQSSGSAIAAILAHVLVQQAPVEMKAAGQLVAALTVTCICVQRNDVIMASTCLCNLHVCAEVQ